MALKVYVDGDSCSNCTIAVIKQIATSYGVEALVVADENHNRLGVDVCVESEPEAVDCYILDRLKPGDLVVARDNGLIGAAVRKQAIGMSPWGKVLHPLEKTEFIWYGWPRKKKKKRKENKEKRVRCFAKSFLKLLDEITSRE